MEKCEQNEKALFDMEFKKLIVDGKVSFENFKKFAAEVMSCSDIRKDLFELGKEGTKNENASSGE